MPWRADQVAAGDLSARIDETASDEIAHVATTLDRTARRRSSRPLPKVLISVRVFAAHYRKQDLRVQDFCWRRGQNVLGQHNEVRQLSWCQHAAHILIEARVRSITGKVA